MITKGGQLLAMEKIDTTVSEGRMLPMCIGEIPGAECYHLTVPAGNTYTLEADEAHYNIFVLIEGECVMSTAEPQTIVQASTPVSHVAITRRLPEQLR